MANLSDAERRAKDEEIKFLRTSLWEIGFGGWVLASTARELAATALGYPRFAPSDIGRRGVALQSASHPRGSWWQRLKWRLWPPRLNAKSLETTEIELPERDR